MNQEERNAELGQTVVDDGEAEGFDFEALKEVAGFAIRAPRRRPILAATAFVTVGGLGLALAVTVPHTYNVQVKLLAQRNYVLPALGNPSRAVPREADEPTRNVSNVVMRHENLVSLVQEANLIERFSMTRPPALRLKDKLLELVAGPRSDADKVDAMVGTLEKRLQVFPADETTVMINVDWNDARTAYDIATLVQKHFLDARYDSEVSIIRDAIAVLEDHANTEHEQVDNALAEYQKLHAERTGTSLNVAANPTSRAAPRPAAQASTSPASTIAAPDPSLTAELEDKRRQIHALEEERQRELDSLKQQLNQAQLTLTPLHPTVIALRQKIDGLGQPSQEVERLKSEERALLARVASAVASPSSVAGVAPSPARGPAVAGLEPARSAPQGGMSTREDPSLAPAREKLEAAIHRYQDLMTHIDSAKLELDIAKTAFAYRYSVLNPAELPRSPKKPIAIFVGLGSVVGAVLAAILGCAGTDWFQGRVLEAWQVRRRCKLEVLGEIDLPTST